MNDLQTKLFEVYAETFPNQVCLDPLRAVEFLASEIRMLRGALRGMLAAPRPKGEITAAHNLLFALGSNPELCKRLLRARQPGHIAAIANVLAWVLRHEEGQIFQDWVDEIHDYMRRAGIEVLLVSPTERSYRA